MTNCFFTLVCAVCEFKSTSEQDIHISCGFTPESVFMSKGSLAGLTTSCSLIDIRTCCVSICLSGVGIKVLKVKLAHQADRASQELRVTVV